MSILESIQVAEEKAEKIKTEATEKVKKLLETTRIESEEKVKAMFQQAVLDDKKLDETTLNEIGEKEKEILSNYELIDQRTVDNAKGRMDIAVEHIMKKVLEL